jgi:hypothetical protein
MRLAGSTQRSRPSASSSAWRKRTEYLRQRLMENRGVLPGEPARISEPCDCPALPGWQQCRSELSKGCPQGDTSPDVGIANTNGTDTGWQPRRCRLKWVCKTALRQAHEPAMGSGSASVCAQRNIVDLSGI